MDRLQNNRGFLKTIKKIKKSGLIKTIRIAKNKIIDYPTTISLDTCSRCNFSCRMCSLRDYGIKGDMSFDIFEKMIDACGNTATVELHSSGEPLMNKRIVDMVRTLKEKSPLVAVEFFTNASLLNEQMASSLVAAGLDKITVSFDGFTKETYEKVRIGASFEQVIANIKMLQDIKRKRNVSKPRLALGFVAMKSNIAELVDIVDLAARVGAYHINVNGLEPYTSDLMSETLYGSHNNDYREYFYKAFKRASEIDIDLALPKLDKMTQRSCMAHKLALISWDGEVRPCPNLSYPRPFYMDGQCFQHNSLSFGNVANASFVDIWNSGEYREFRKNIRAKNFPSVCDGCLLSYGVICPI